MLVSCSCCAYCILQFAYETGSFLKAYSGKNIITILANPFLKTVTTTQIVDQDKHLVVSTLYCFLRFLRNKINYYEITACGALD